MDFPENNPSPGARLTMGLRLIRATGSNKGCKITGISGKKEESFRKISREGQKYPFFPSRRLKTCFIPLKNLHFPSSKVPMDRLVGICFAHTTPPPSASGFFKSPLRTPNGSLTNFM